MSLSSNKFIANVNAKSVKMKEIKYTILYCVCEIKVPEA